VQDTWTLGELVAEAANRLEALPPPKNGQVRAVPDERTIRYYATIGLLDRPAAMRGRTALYARRHLAQVVAIKRMQSAGHSLADIQAMWPTLDEVTLSRMSGVQVGTSKAKSARKDFWKREAEAMAQTTANIPTAPSGPTITFPSTPAPQMPPRANAPMALPVPTFTPYASPSAPATTTIHVPLDGNVSIAIALTDDATISLSAADVRALRAAAAPLVAELANRGLIAPTGSTLEEEP